MNKTRPITSALALALYGIGALAQEPLVLEEVIVTAQKRSESLQDVPVAVNAFTSDTILEAGILGRPVIASDVPGNRELIPHKETGLLFGTEIIGNAVQNHLPHATDSSSIGFYIFGPDWTHLNLSSMAAGWIFTAIALAATVWLRQHRWELK